MDTVVTLATIPAVVALVNFLKGMGVKGRALMAAALVLGVAINIAEYLVSTAPATPEGVYSAIAAGAILGLSASGLYDLTAQPETAEIEYVELPEEIVRDNDDVVAAQ